MIYKYKKKQHNRGPAQKNFVLAPRFRDEIVCYFTENRNVQIL